MAREDKQDDLFNAGEWWEEHWKEMPEYVSEDLRPYKSIMVHFEDDNAMREFSALVGQKVGIKTKCIWYPEAEIGRIANKRYVSGGTSVLYKERQRPE